MKIRISTYLTLLKSISILCLGLVLMVSCSKSDTPTDPSVEPPKEEESNTALYNKVIKVRNFPGTEKNDGANAAPTVLYSLETNKGIPQSHRQTRNWDIAFGNIFNSHASGNNGSDKTNYGYGNNATGGILIVEQDFDTVIDIPNDSQFKTIGDAIGMDQHGDEGNGVGWLLYDFHGQLVREHSTQNEHVVYALGNGLSLKSGTMIKPRTLIVRTAKGNYAKIKPISIYKDKFSPDSWFKDTPHVYISFDYVIVPKGSKSFEVKP